MKLKELFESMDFSPVVWDSESEAYRTPDKKVFDTCNVCGGDGKDANDMECQYCHGAGKREQYEPTVPTLNVANRNGELILQMMGVPFDHSGIIKNEKLPEVKRRLLALKNQDRKRSQFEIPDEEFKGKKETYVDKSGDVPRIGTRGGAQVYSMGVRPEQINRYIDSMLNMIEVAQKEKMDLMWT
jgi:hypothetical protein